MPVEHASDDNIVAKLPAQRLCNEIQLFDLCDLDTCSCKEGRYCANAELLTAFERISDVEDRPGVCVSEELDEGEETSGDEYDDDFEDDESGDDAEYEEED